MWTCLESKKKNIVEFEEIELKNKIESFDLEKLSFEKLNYIKFLIYNKEKRNWNYFLWLGKLFLIYIYISKCDNKIMIVILNLKILEANAIWKVKAFINSSFL